MSTVRQTFYKWRKFSIVDVPPRCGRPLKMTMRAPCRMLNVVRKNLQKDLQKSLAHANIIDDKSVTAETLNKNGGHGRTPRRKQLLSKKHCCTFEVYKRAPGCSPSTTGNIFCGQMKPKFSCLEGTHKKKKITAHQHQMVWGCFAASGPGQIAVIDGKMNSQVLSS